METRKHQSYLPDRESTTDNPIQPDVSLDALRRIELEILLEDLAGVIESADGILTP